MCHDGAHVKHESFLVSRDIHLQNLLWKVASASIVPAKSVILVIDDQLRTEVNVRVDTARSFSGLLILDCTGHVVQAERQEWLPRILECLTHGARDAALVLSEHLLDIPTLVGHLPLCRLILLQAVKVESVAAFRERHTCLVLFVDHIVELQLLHDEIVPFDMEVFRHGRATIHTLFRLTH